MKRIDAWVTYLQVAPLSLVFLLFLVVPIGTIVVVSFFDYNTTQIIPDFLLQNYEELLLSPVDLSSRVGLDVETVKRTVQRLRDQQYIRIVGERVEIPDLDALRRLYALLGSKEELRGER